MILLPAKEHHVRTLLENLREEDRRELDLCLEGSGLDRCDAVLEQWKLGDICEAILTDSGAVAGVWGVHEGYAPDVGLIWMLGTPLLPSVSIPFLRACRGAVDRAHGIFDTLACTAWRENSLHLAWLEWCGFTPYDPGHGPFIGYTHVRSSGSPARNAGRNCGERGGTEPAAEPVD